MNHTKNSTLTGWYVVAISSIFGCMMGGSFSQYAMTTTQLALKTGIAPALLLTAETAKSTAIIIAMLISGVLVQKFGFKTVTAASIVLFLVPQLLIPHNNSVIVLFLLKIMQGLATIVFPVFITTIIHSVEERNTGLATAIFNGIFYSGAGIGAFIAGLVIANLGWIASYYVIGGIVAVFGIVWLLTVKGAEQDSQVVTINPHEAHRQSDVGYGTMLKNSKAWLLVGIFLAYTWVLQTIAVNIPAFSESLGYDAVRTGNIMTATSIGIIFSALVSGKISDFFASKAQNKFAARVWVISFGAVLIFGCAMLMSFTDLSSFGVFYVVCLLYSIGGAWGLGVFWSIVPELFKNDGLSLATGFIGGLGDCSMPVAPFIVGVVFGAKGLWSMGWLSSAVMGAISLLCCFAVLRISKKQEG